MPICCIEIQDEEDILGWDYYLLYSYFTSRGIYCIVFKHICNVIKDKARFIFSEQTCLPQTKAHNHYYYDAHV